MTRYEAIEKALRGIMDWAEEHDLECKGECRNTACRSKAARAALALPEDSKTVNAEDDGWPKLGKPARVGNTTFAPRVSSRLVVECAQRAYEYKLREASGEPMPYKVVRDGDNVRFE